MRLLARLAALLVTAALLTSVGGTAAMAAEPVAPVAYATPRSAIAINNLAIVGTPTGITVDFDYSMPSSSWSPLAIGIYSGTTADYPIATSTFEKDNLGENGHVDSFDTAASVIQYPDVSGHVTRSYPHSRSVPITVIVYGPEGFCDCSMGWIADSGAIVAPLNNAPQALTSTPKPTISGTAKVHSTLRVTAGTWAPGPVALTYRWLINGVAASGATSTAFKVPSSALGKKVTVAVTGAKTGYTSTKMLSAATTAVKAGTLTATPVPKVTGIVKVGSKLTLTAGAWTPAPVTLAYRWNLNGKPLAAATGKTFVLPASAVGKKVTVTVTGKKSGYTSVNKISKATGYVKKR